MEPLAYYWWLFSQLGIISESVAELYILGIKVYINALSFHILNMLQAMKYNACA
jgi:hypothetical protein